MIILVFWLKSRHCPWCSIYWHVTRWAEMKPKLSWLGPEAQGACAHCHFHLPTSGASWRWPGTPPHHPGSPPRRAPAGGWTRAGRPAPSGSLWWPCLPPARWGRLWGYIRTVASAERRRAHWGEVSQRESTTVHCKFSPRNQPSAAEEISCGIDKLTTIAYGQ